MVFCCVCWILCRVIERHRVQVQAQFCDSTESTKHGRYRVVSFRCIVKWQFGQVKVERLQPILLLLLVLRSIIVVAVVGVIATMSARTTTDAWWRVDGSK
jgi:hypothetical protein